MNNQRGSAMIGIIIVLAVIYVMALLISFGGWGYPGYRGYHRGPSFWYFGGPRYHYGPSLRAGSTGGPSHVGGGHHGGK